jgi:LysR family hydrogen peroxide-inducible transcriptional activator
MTLRELRYLVALADHRHFGRAADACHVTQSTLSVQIRKLENYLGQTLVDRQGKQFGLTPIGERILNHAQRLLAEADGILALTRVRRAPLEGALTLGIIPTLAPYYLPHLLQTLGSAFPKLQLVVQEGLTGELCQRLDEQSLDAALLALPRPLAPFVHAAACLQCEAAVQAVPRLLDPEAYRERALFDEPFWVALPSAHSLAGDIDVAVDALGDLKLLLLTDGHCLRGQALEVCRAAGHGIDDTADCRATSLETLQQLVAAGRGCTLLPALAASHADPARLSVKRLRGGEHRRIGLVWRRAHPRTQEFDLLATTLCRAAPPGTLPWRPADLPVVEIAT